MNREERQQALRRLHLYIAAYEPSQEDLAVLHKAHQDLVAQIEQKFSQSIANQNYVFPRDSIIEEEPYEGAGRAELHRMTKGKPHEALQKPKIKLIKPKLEKRIKTEYYRDQNTIGSFLGQQSYPHLSANIHRKDLEPELKRPLRDILNQSSNAGHLALTREISSCSKSKSKLSQLTRSYANLKSRLGGNWQTVNNEGRTCQASFKQPNFDKKISSNQVEAQSQRNSQFWSQAAGKAKEATFKEVKTYIKLK